MSENEKTASDAEKENAGAGEETAKTEASNEKAVHASPIKGYRPLTQSQIDLMNDVKEMEAQVGGVWRRVKASGADARFTSIAKTSLQQAFMDLNRAIAQPQDVFDEAV